MLAAAPPAIDPSDPLTVVELKRQPQFAHLKIQLLEERLRLQRIQKYGPASEKLSNAQLELLEEEPGVSNLELAAESAREPLPPAAPLQPKRTRKHPGRQALPPDLSRVERVIPCTPEQSHCAHCGEPTEVSRLEKSPAIHDAPSVVRRDGGVIALLKREPLGRLRVLIRSTPVFWHETGLVLKSPPDGRLGGALATGALPWQLPPGANILGNVGRHFER